MPAAARTARPRKAWLISYKVPDGTSDVGVAVGVSEVFEVEVGPVELDGLVEVGSSEVEVVDVEAGVDVGVVEVALVEVL